MYTSWTQEDFLDCLLQQSGPEDCCPRQPEPGEEPLQNAPPVASTVGVAAQVHTYQFVSYLCFLCCGALYKARCPAYMFAGPQLQLSNLLLSAQWLKRHSFFLARFYLVSLCFCRQDVAPGQLLASPSANMPGSAAAGAAVAGGQGLWGTLAAAHLDPNQMLALSAPSLASDMLQWSGDGLASVFSTVPQLAPANGLDAFDGMALDALLPSDMLLAPLSTGGVLGDWQATPSPTEAATAATAGGGEVTPSLGYPTRFEQAVSEPWGSAAMDTSASAPVWLADSRVLGGSPAAHMLASNVQSMPLPAAPMLAAGGISAGGDSSTRGRKLRARTLSLPNLNSRYAAL